MVKDRLADLKERRPSIFKSLRESIRRKSLRRQGTVNNFLADVTAIDKTLATLKDCIAETKRLQATILSSPGSDKKLNAKLAACNVENRSISANVRRLINELKVTHESQSTSDPEQAAAGKRVIQNQLERLVTELAEIIQDWHSAQASYGDKLKERLRREYSIVGESKTDIELNDMMAQDQPHSVFTQNILHEIQDAQTTLDQVQEREKEIRNLEKSVVQVHELFNDFQVLVTEQGETIDNIEANVDKSKGNVEIAIKETKQAKQYQSKARRKKCIVAIIIVVVVVVIGVIITLSLVL